MLWNSRQWVIRRLAWTAPRAEYLVNRVAGMVSPVYMNDEVWWPAVHPRRVRVAFLSHRLSPGSLVLSAWRVYSPQCAANWDGEREKKTCSWRGDGTTTLEEQRSRNILVLMHIMFSAVVGPAMEMVKQVSLQSYSKLFKNIISSLTTISLWNHTWRDSVYKPLNGIKRSQRQSK